MPDTPVRIQFMGFSDGGKKPDFWYRFSSVRASSVAALEDIVGPHISNDLEPIRAFIKNVVEAEEWGQWLDMSINNPNSGHDEYYRIVPLSPDSMRTSKIGDGMNIRRPNA